MGNNGNGYRMPALRVHDASKGDLEAVLTRLVESGRVAAEDVNNELAAVREITAERANAISEAALTKEQAELLTKLEAQYPAMKATLERRKISTKGMPTWELIKKGLTPDVLDKALKHAEPELVLVPPTRRQSKVDAINKYPAKCQKQDTYTYKLNDNDLWNGGKSQTENKWRVKIDEGVEDVPQDEEIYDGKRTNYEMTKLWVAKYEEEGLDVIDDADEYLVLMMKQMDEGKPVDPNTYTVLNGKSLTKSSLVARGVWVNDRVILVYGNPASVGNGLRLRASVGVDIG